MDSYLHAKHPQTLLEGQIKTQNTKGIGSLSPTKTRSSGPGYPRLGYLLLFFLEQPTNACQTSVVTVALVYNQVKVSMSSLRSLQTPLNQNRKLRTNLQTSGSQAKKCTRQFKHHRYRYITYSTIEVSDLVSVIDSDKRV